MLVLAFDYRQSVLTVAMLDPFGVSLHDRVVDD
jgi:hypothetical protein